MPVHDPNASHTKPCAVNPYTGETSQQLRRFLIPVQAPNASHTNPYVVQVPNNSSNSLCRCRLPTIHTQILMLVQVPEDSHTHPSTCTGSQQFRQFLMPGQPPNNSKSSLNDQD
ncbi:hypothetical protein O181_063516 [Austropuccinia psidii MF-1]|uniref:Uncharacterized protein n=1 Tax=Austropuccinia psidii MF-1 TaxID=1389203 RepID=A0A9Q3EK64_9BASI|nr:hypothetical protein [Austropuccinia psidii MF-1]